MSKFTKFIHYFERKKRYEALLAIRKLPWIERRILKYWHREATKSVTQLSVFNGSMYIKLKPFV
jgi:flagellar biosynthesis regulator FlbT